jgi:DNA-binding MltR family transcriptional regulator
MSNRDALRKLSRIAPAPPEIDKIMDGLATADDMSAAIIAGSLVEVELERLILTKFKVSDPNLASQIFQNRGPLSDLHSKIVIAHAFGFVTSPMASELHSLKAIRNAFAHARFPITFEHEVVAKEVASLQMIKAMRDKIDEQGDWEITNVGWYLLLTRILLIMFDEIKKHGGSANEAVTDALHPDRQT